MKKTHTNNSNSAIDFDDINVKAIIGFSLTLIALLLAYIAFIK